MRKKANRNRTAIACIIAAAASASLAAQTNLDLTAGGDIRLRYDGTDSLPTSSRGESKASDYGRFRFRGWMKADYEDSSLYMRVADEFRAYRAPGSNSRKQRWPDVLFIDNLYFEEKNIFGSLDLRIGRQDLVHGRVPFPFRRQGRGEGRQRLARRIQPRNGNGRDDRPDVRQIQLHESRISAPRGRMRDRRIL